MPDTDHNDNEPGVKDTFLSPVMKRGTRRLIPAAAGFLAFAVAGLLGYYWLTNRPKPQRHPPKAKPALVEVISVRPQAETVVITAMGTVVPAKTVDLAARVEGEVVFVSPEFIPGGRIKKGDILIRVDPRDYELFLRQKQAELDKSLAELEQCSAEVMLRETEIRKAESDLAIEMGQQAVARREYELLGKTLDPEDAALVLRKPQLEAAQASVAAAKAEKQAAEASRRAAIASKSSAEVALEQAKIDLERTIVRAPFDAIVQSRSVELGSQVTQNTSLGTLVGTEEYWIEVSVPADQLKWIDIPGFNAEQGSGVRIYYEAAWGAQAFRLGTVKSLLPDLETQGRMAKLLISMPDPLDIRTKIGQRHPLLSGSYVRVQIQGHLLPNVVRVPRFALHDGNTVWIMKPDNTLEIRPVKITWSAREFVLASEGLAEGELLITSDLAAPVQGMKLRVIDSLASASSTGHEMPYEDLSHQLEERK